MILTSYGRTAAILEQINLYPLYDSDGEPAEYALVLASCGEQLKHADLVAFSVEDALIVIEAYPNVKTRIQTEDPQTLTVLGSHLQELSLFVYERN